MTMHICLPGKISGELASSRAGVAATSYVVLFDIIRKDTSTLRELVLGTPIFSTLICTINRAHSGCLVKNITEQWSYGGGVGAKSLT